MAHPESCQERQKNEFEVLKVSKQENSYIIAS